MSDEPIFVLGYQRSGTTLLQSMLGAHRDIVAPPEIYFFIRIAALAPYYGDLHEDANLQRVIEATLRSPIGALDAYDLNPAELFDSIADGPRRYGDVLTAVMAAVTAKAGKRRWTEKSPGQHASHILSLLPQSKLVHIVRDPRDVVASTLAAPWVPDGARRIAIAARRHLLESIATGRRAGPRRYMMIRYEDLTRDPEAVLHQVCDFIGEEFDPAMLDGATRAAAGTVIDAARPWQHQVEGPVSTDRQGSWTTRLRPIEKVRVAAIVHRELPALGYEPARRRLVLVGTVLNQASRPTDLPARLEQRRFARRLKSEGPDVLFERLTEFLAETMKRVSAPPSQ